MVFFVDETGDCSDPIPLGFISNELVTLLSDRFKERPNIYQDSDEYLLPYSNRRLLTDEDLRYLNADNMDLARNEILARHGYPFTENLYINYFAEKTWYKKNVNYNSKLLNKIESENINFLKDSALQYRKFFNATKKTTVEADLNSDGKNEVIRLEYTKGRGPFTLFVNEQQVIGYGTNLEGSIAITDIDTKDKYKEIALGEDGPSYDHKSYFYYYDGKKLISMGDIPGANISHSTTIEIDGSGIFTSYSRGEILQYWHHKETYQLTDKHQIEKVDTDLYEMNAEVLVLNYIYLQKSHTDANEAYTLTPGEIATITHSDDKECCLVKNSKGQEGWFCVVGYRTIRGTGKDADYFFQGLYHAD